MITPIAQQGFALQERGSQIPVSKGAPTNSYQGDLKVPENVERSLLEEFLEGHTEVV